MEGRPTGRSFGRGQRSGAYNRDGSFHDNHRGRQNDRRYDRGPPLHRQLGPDYGTPMGQPFHDPHWGPGPAMARPDMGPYPGYGLPPDMLPAQGPPPPGPHYDQPWQMLPLGPGVPPPPQYEGHQMWDPKMVHPQPLHMGELPPHMQELSKHMHVLGHQMWGHDMAQPQQPYMGELPPHMQELPLHVHAAPAHTQAHQQASAPWHRQPQEVMLPPLPPSEPDAPPPPPDMNFPAPGAAQDTKAPPLPDQGQPVGQPGEDAALPHIPSANAKPMPDMESSDMAITAPKAGGKHKTKEAGLQYSPTLALSQENASQATPSPGPFKMELKAKATPSPLQKNPLKVLKGNPSLLAGVQRRTPSILGPRLAGQDMPVLSSAQKEAGTAAAHTPKNNGTASSKTPPWLPAGTALTAGPKQDVTSTPPWLTSTPAAAASQDTKPAHPWLAASAAPAAVSESEIHLPPHSKQDNATAKQDIALLASGTAEDMAPAQDPALEGDQIAQPLPSAHKRVQVAFNLPSAHSAAQEQAQAAQNGLSNHSDDRSSSPDSKSSGSTRTSDSSDSRSSASSSSSRDTSPSSRQRDNRSHRRSLDRGTHSRSQWRDERYREPSRERLRYTDRDRDRDRDRNRESYRDRDRDRGRDRSRDRHRDVYGDRHIPGRHHRDYDRHTDRSHRDYDRHRRRDDYRTPERAEALSSERVHAQSGLLTRSPESRDEHRRPRRPSPEGRPEGKTLPPPPPDEPDQEHAAVQEEALFIRHMNQSIKGRISNLAAGFRVDFGALHQNDARALNELLIRQVYPDQPDFFALDAIDDALTQLDETEGAGSQTAHALSNLQLGPEPVQHEDREQTEDFLCPLSVPWSPKAKVPTDPRPQPEPGEVPAEAAPMLLALPMFAIYAETEEKDWDQESTLSWSQTPKRHGANDEAISAPFAPAAGDMMQAPAAPQHELMVQEDGRDWALEQMTQAAAPSTAARAEASMQRPVFEDISADVEEWSWIERRKDTVQLNSSKHSLQDLSRLSQEGRRGVCPGACVFRDRDQLWIPLTERGFAAKELEWVEEQDVPDVDAQDAACPYTAAVSVAEGMSEEALAQWIDSFPADGRPEGAAPPHQPQDKSIGLPTLDVEVGEANSSSSESTQQWFDSFNLSEDARAAAQVRAQANAAAAEEAFTKKHGPSGVHEGRAVWGPRPPPQHAALVRARLVIAAVGHADGRTLVADLIQRALHKVREEKKDELSARRQARQAQQMKHAPHTKHADKPSSTALEKQPQGRSGSAARSEGLNKTQEHGRKRKHEQGEPVLNGRQDQEGRAQQQASAQPEPSTKAGAVLANATAVLQQQKILSSAGVPDTMRLEAAAKQMTPAAADGAARKVSAAGERARSQPAGREAKSGVSKRKRLQLDDSSDDDAEPGSASKAVASAQPDPAAKGKEPKLTTPVKAAKRAKSSTPGSAAKGFAAKSSEDGDAEDHADQEQRKMREAAEKAQENSRQDAMKNAMLQAIRLLIQYDGKELSQLFLKSATGYDGYLDVIENPICLMDIMNKHQKQLKYPLNKDGFDAIRADLKLMCDNCHTYNMGVQDLEESADMMWKEANKQLDAYYKKALSDISSLMSGQRAR